MSAERWHHHGPAVTVVTGVVNVLESGRQVDAPPNVRCVIRLENVLSPVAQPAIADQETVAALGKIILMILLDSIGNEGQAGTVLLAIPLRAVHAQTFGHGQVDLGVGK